MVRFFKFYIAFCTLAILGVNGAIAAEQAQNVITEQKLVAELLAREARIKSIDTIYSIKSVGADGRNGEFGGEYAREGNKELLTDVIPKISTRAYTFDGKVIRELQIGDDPQASPSALVGLSPHATFARKSNHISGFTARMIWENEFIPALEAGKAKIAPRVVKQEGYDCIEIVGQMKTKEKDGMDGMYFRVLFDPQCGYMPRYLEEYLKKDNDVVIRNIMDQYQVVEISPGIWMPTQLRQRSMARQVDQSWKTNVTNTITVEIKSVNKPLDAARFELKFPKGTNVMDMLAATRPSDALIYKVGDDLPAEQFDHVVGKIDAAKKDGPPAPSLPIAPAAEAPPEGKPYQAMLLVGGGAAFLVGAALIVRQRQKSISAKQIR
jgi:hypothetical protein